MAIRTNPESIARRMMLSPKGPENISGKGVKIENRSVIPLKRFEHHGGRAAHGRNDQSGLSSADGVPWPLGVGTRRSHPGTGCAANINTQRVADMKGVPGSPPIPSSAVQKISGLTL